MPSHAGAAGRAPGLGTLYVAIWGILAVAAAAYLAVLVLRPDLVSGTLRTAATATPQAVFGNETGGSGQEIQGLGRAVTELRTEIGGVKEALARQEDQVRDLATLRTEVGELRSSVANQEERQRSLSGRLASFEAQAMAHAAATQGSAAPQQPTVNVGGGVLVTGSLQEQADATPRGDAKASSTPEPRRTAAKSAQQPATGTPVPAFGPAKVVTFTGPVGLQLGTGPSPDDLRLSWLRLNSGNKDTLQSFEPRYVQAKGGDAPLYRLIAGPVANAEEAARLCNQLKARKLNCSVTAFSGQPL